MDGIRELLDVVRTQGLLKGRFRALLHIAIGRTVTRPDGTVISTGNTWRALAALLKELRYDRELVREFGADPDTLAPRDRERFWYSAIVQARVDTPEASAEADALAAELKKIGYSVGPNPTTISASQAARRAEPKGKASEEPQTKPESKAREERPGKGKKK